MTADQQPSDSDVPQEEQWMIVSEKEQSDEEEYNAYLYYKAFSNNNDFVLFHAVGDTIDWASKNIIGLVGTETVHPIRKTVSELIHPDDADKARNLFKRVYQSGKEADDTLRIIREDHSVLWVKITLKPYDGEAGGRESVGLIRSAMREREVEDILSEQGKAYKALSEHATDIVLTTNLDMQITWVSSNITKNLGWLLEDLEGRSSSILVHPDDHVKAAGERSRLLDDSPDQVDSVSTILRILKKSGEYLWMAGDLTPIKNEEERIVGVVSGWRNVDELVRTREESEERGRKLTAVLDSLMNPHATLEAVRDADGTIVDFLFSEPNESAVEYLGLSREELEGKSFLSLFPGVVGIGIFKKYTDVVESGIPLLIEDLTYFNEMLNEDRHYNIRAARIDESLSFTWNDITDKYLEAKRIADSEKRYRLLAENVSDVVLQINAHGEITWASESITSILGWDREYVLTQVQENLIHPDDHMRAREVNKNMPSGEKMTGEYRILCADGSWRWMIGTIHQLNEGEGTQRIISLRDIHSEIEMRETLAKVLDFDPLTGLLRREKLQESLHHYLEATAGTSLSVGVLCIDVDSLAKVNDALTHRGGDTLMQVIGERIYGNAWNEDCIGRGTGDEFYLIVPNMIDAVQAGKIAERIRLDVKTPTAVEDMVIEPTVSIGIAMGNSESPAESVMRDANFAMRQAKDNGRNRIAYLDSGLADQAQQFLSMEESIRKGISDEEFKAWFMPIVEMKTGEVKGYEALVRWIRSYGSVVSPDFFLSIAERSLLLPEIDRIVMSQSLDKIASSDDVDMFIAVNVSPASLSSIGFVDTVRDGLTSRNIDPARLHLEVTETTLINLNDDVLKAMQTLHDLGVQWYVDDFGTGYSSISHLRDMPISGLKLDMSFTRGIGRGDEKSIKLGNALAGLADGLEIESVAEGVETQEQANLLIGQGWTYGQGWLYGKAAPNLL